MRALVLATSTTTTSQGSNKNTLFSSQPKTRGNLPREDIALLTQRSLEKLAEAETSVSDLEYSHEQQQPDSDLFRQDVMNLSPLEIDALDAKHCLKYATALTDCDTVLGFVLRHSSWLSDPMRQHIDPGNAYNEALAEKEIDEVSLEVHSEKAYPFDLGFTLPVYSQDSDLQFETYQFYFYLQNAIKDVDRKAGRFFKLAYGTNEKQVNEIARKEANVLFRIAARAQTIYDALNTVLAHGFGIEPERTDLTVGICMYTNFYVDEALIIALNMHASLMEISITQGDNPNDALAFYKDIVKECYQLTPNTLKETCLELCRSPLSTFISPTCHMALMNVLHKAALLTSDPLTAAYAQCAQKLTEYKTHIGVKFTTTQDAIRQVERLQQRLAHARNVADYQEIEAIIPDENNNTDEASSFKISV